MTQLILAIVYAFLDVARAILDLALRRRRNQYRANAIVRASRATVWDLLMRLDVTYVANGITTKAALLAGHDNIFVARMTRGGKTLPALAYRHETVSPPDRLVVRYLPDLSDPQQHLGRDDLITIQLAPLPDGTTRLEYCRDIEHATSATRISAPLGVRSAAQMLKMQAEHEAGIAPARQSLLQQLCWTALAFLSFAWLLDWRTAVLLMAIIALHELGHALAMLWYGLGISFVSFIPFLGGVAAPRRPYETEWQRCMVALAGVGFSLPFSLAAIWIAETYGAANVGAAAILTLVINGANLVPFPALDGSIVVSTLLGKLSPRLNQIITIAMFALFVALGLYLQDALIWAAIAFSFVSVVQVLSLKIDDQLVKMRWTGSAVMICLYAGLIAAHINAFVRASVATARAEGQQIDLCLARIGQDRSQMRAIIAACREEHQLWFLR